MASSKEASTWDHELTARPVAAENRGAGRRGPDARHGKSGVVRVLALTLMFFIGALLTAVPRSSAEPPEPPFLDLGTLPADTMSGASAVNEAGQVVGWSQGSYPDPIHAFLWENGTMTDLGTLGGSTARAYDINDKGQVVGVSSTSSGLNHAFLWEDGTMTDLGTLGGPDSYAYGLDNRGFRQASRLPLVERLDERHRDPRRRCGRGLGHQRRGPDRGGQRGLRFVPRLPLAGRHDDGPRDARWYSWL